MTGDLPEDTPQLETARRFDSARLIGQVRRGDQAAIEEAYRLTFGNDLGRVVLLHALTSIGEIGMARGAETPAESNHKNGRGYAVLKMAGFAGFDPVAIAAAGMTQILEGADYEHGYGRSGRDYDRQPDIDFGDSDAFDGGAPDGTAGSGSDGPSGFGDPG